MSSRDDAWRAVHDPATDAAALGRIAQAHPEFAEAILRHPNCYDGLRTWLGAHAASDPPVGEAAPTGSPNPIALVAEEAPTTAPPPSPKRRWLVAAGLGVGALAAVGGGLAAWAVLTPPPTVDAQPEASEPAATSQAAYDGPWVFTGDELEWFLLDDATISEVLHGSETSGVTDVFGAIGESEGAIGDPIVCGPLVLEDYSQFVGYRTVRWAPDVTEYMDDSVSVAQFASVERAVEHFDAFDAAGEGCAAYRPRPDDPTPPRAFRVLEQSERDGVRVLVGEVTGEADDASNREMVLALVQHGNVVVKVDVALDASQPVDAEALAEALFDRSADARTKLAERMSGQ